MTTAAAPKMKRSSRRRFALAALGLALAAAAAFVGWLGYRNVGRARDLRAAIAAVEAVDPHWRLEAIEARRAPVPDDENSSVVMRHILARLPAGQRPPYNDLGDVQRREAVIESQPPEVRLSDEQYTVMIDALEGVEAGIGPALALARYPRGRHPITYAPDGVSTPLRHVDDAGVVLWRVLQPLLFVSIHEGDGGGALRVCHAAINLGRSMGDDPNLFAQLNRTRYSRAAIRGLERVLGQGEVPEAELARMQELLTEEAAFDPWALALRGERAMAFQALEAVRSGLLKPSFLVALTVGRRPGPPPTAVERVRDWLNDRIPPDVRPAQAWLLRHDTRVQETARLPWPERRTALDALTADEAGAPELARLFVVNNTRAANVFESAMARCRCGAVAAALERHRRRHGRWPDSLAALVPDLLPAVPSDPFDSQPLRYRRLADGVVVYSVWIDRTDDGGKLADAFPSPAGSGLGVRLWDVPHRRQPPRTPPPEAPP
jgi:hypothetical protein